MSILQGWRLQISGHLDPTLDHLPYKNILFYFEVEFPAFRSLSARIHLGKVAQDHVQSPGMEIPNFYHLIQHLTILPIEILSFYVFYCILGPYQPGSTLAMDAKIPLFGIPQFPGGFSLKPQPRSPQGLQRNPRPKLGISNLFYSRILERSHRDGFDFVCLFVLFWDHKIHNIHFNMGHRIFCTY